MSKWRLKVRERKRQQENSSSWSFASNAWYLIIHQIFLCTFSANQKPCLFYSCSSGPPWHFYQALFFAMWTGTYVMPSEDLTWWLNIYELLPERNKKMHSKAALFTTLCFNFTRSSSLIGIFIRVWFINGLGCPRTNLSCNAALQMSQVRNKMPTRLPLIFLFYWNQKDVGRNTIMSSTENWGNGVCAPPIIIHSHCCTIECKGAGGGGCVDKKTGKMSDVFLSLF